MSLDSRKLQLQAEVFTLAAVRQHSVMMLQLSESDDSDEVPQNGDRIKSQSKVILHHCEHSVIAYE